jgi:hypothetical protein
MDQQDVLVPFAITLLHTKYIYIYIGVNGTLVFLTRWGVKKTRGVKKAMSVVKKQGARRQSIGLCKVMIARMAPKSHDSVV